VTIYSFSCYPNFIIFKWFKTCFLHFQSTPHSLICSWQIALKGMLKVSRRICDDRFFYLLSKLHNLQMIQNLFLELPISSSFPHMLLMYSINNNLITLILNRHVLFARLSCLISLYYLLKIGIHYFKEKIRLISWLTWSNLCNIALYTTSFLTLTHLTFKKKNMFLLFIWIAL